MIKAEEALNIAIDLNEETENLFCEFDTIIGFIKQYLTPTFDEVVKAWEEYYPSAKVTKRDWGVNVDTDLGNFQISNTGALNTEFFLYGKGVINAINLTIRYLEGQT